MLAHNALGRALFAGHANSGDLVRLVFLDPDAREFSPDWEQVAANTVDGLRSAAGIDTNDPQLVRTVGELSLKSPEFHRLAVTLTGGNRNDGLPHPRMRSHLLATRERVASRGSHSSASPHSWTTTSSPTDGLPGRTTENFAPNTTPPVAARR
ncbi:hypothetical protein SAMN05216268_104190 [Streptomyces yunnanensis]|uniref:MmyB-like transcription regulator ligand binding domain-containing protein n=1 Tax=Streptomyces yunnanensis TaxID=156453 RepID=A0A9X8QQP5_9ACTN|nr:hypothetical protein SAMN05216268_104190 [Streptomyces yunnanensis]